MDTQLVFQYSRNELFAHRYRAPLVDIPQTRRDASRRFVGVQWETLLVFVWNDFRVRDSEYWLLLETHVHVDEGLTMTLQPSC